MFTLKFQRSKVGGTPAFSLSLPAPELLLSAVASDPEKSAWIVSQVLRKINDGSGKGGIRLFDESGSVWGTEKFLSIIAQGQAVSNSSTWTAEDFAAEWADGLGELTAALVPADKVEAAKAILAQAVRHGGKGQLSDKQCQAILKVYGSATNDSPVIAIAVTNAKARKQELDEQNALLAELDF